MMCMFIPLFYRIKKKKKKKVCMHSSISNAEFGYTMYVYSMSTTSEVYRNIITDTSMSVATIYSYFCTLLTSYLSINLPWNKGLFPLPLITLVFKKGVRTDPTTGPEQLVRPVRQVPDHFSEAIPLSKSLS